MRAVHVAVVGKEEHMRVLVEAQFFQRRANTAHVPVQIFDHGVVARQIAPGALHDARDVRHVGAQLHLSWNVTGHEFRRRVVGIVRRDDRQCGKEGLFLLRALLQMRNEEIGQRVSFVAGQTVLEGIVARAAMDPAIELWRIVFITHPLPELAAALRRDDVQAGAAIALLEAVHMPLAVPGRVIARFIETGGDGRVLR